MLETDKYISLRVFLHCLERRLLQVRDLDLLRRLEDLEHVVHGLHVVQDLEGGRGDVQPTVVHRPLVLVQVTG